MNSGGTLAGTGTVGDVTVHAGGILAPPTGVPGSLAVSGSLAFASGAIYLVNVTSANASAANVSGVATLTGGSVRTAFSAGTQMGTSYTILTSAGLVGTFSGLSGNVPAGFIETLSYVGNTVMLNVTTTLGGTGTPGNGGQGGGNQQNVTDTLVNYFNNGGMLPPAIVAMFGLTGNNLSVASSQLSGEAATGAQSSAFQLMGAVLGLMTDPFVEGRGGGGNAIGFAAEDATLPPEIATAYAAVFKAPPRQALPFEQRWNVWGSAFGGADGTDGNPVVGSHDLTASAGGFAAGADYRVTPFTTVGFALAGAGTGWSLAQGLGTGRSDALMAGIYGRTTSGPAYVAASLAFAIHWMSTDRISFASDQLTAKFNAQSYGGRIEAGYRFRLAAACRDALCRGQCAGLRCTGLQRTGCERRHPRSHLCGPHRDRHPRRSRREVRSPHRNRSHDAAGAARQARLRPRLGEQSLDGRGLPGPARDEFHRQRRRARA